MSHGQPSKDANEHPVQDAMVVYCVGNGGHVARVGAMLTHCSMAGFLDEVAPSGFEVCFFHWRELHELRERGLASVLTCVPGEYRQAS